MGTSQNVSPSIFRLSTGKLFLSLVKMVNDQDWNSNPNLPTLKQVRERLGMTQEQFAQELGITGRTIRNYERGAHQLKLSLGQFKRLKELLEQAGMSINDLPDDID